MRNLYGNLVEKFVSVLSVEWIKRDVPAIDEVEKMDETSGSLVKQVIFPPSEISITPVSSAKDLGIVLDNSLTYDQLNL